MDGNAVHVRNAQSVWPRPAEPARVTPFSGIPNAVYTKPEDVRECELGRARRSKVTSSSSVQDFFRRPRPRPRSCPAREGFRAGMTIERGETGRVDSSGNIWCLVVQAQLPAFLLQSRGGTRQASLKQADAGQQCDGLETANCDRYYSNG